MIIRETALKKYEYICGKRNNICFFDEIQMVNEFERVINSFRATLDKYFLTDLGLGRIHNSGYKLEMGAMLENIVYNELRNRDYEVYVGKISSGEVDFMAVKGDQREYYQVAYYLTDQSVIERELY